MGWRDTGNPPHNSTTSLANGQSTSALLAEISTLSHGLYEVRWIVGGSSNATWKLEHALSSGITDTSYRDLVYSFSAPFQSALYVQTYKIEDGDRLRVRLASTVTGTYAGHISAEQLT